MQTVLLPGTARETTRLGFGCSSIMGALSRRDSLRLLDCACDHGIRHFDAAPMYGYGEAESCLGDLLQRHPADLTITTKYGISPAKRSTFLRLGRRLAGPVVKRLPALKHRLAKAANAAATYRQAAPAWTAGEAKASLERSLSALRATRIDLWLLHEATAEDLTDPSLLQFLEDQVNNGTIGAFGIGSAAEKVPALAARHPHFCRVLQHEWSVFNPTIPPGDSFRIYHRALTPDFRTLHAGIRQNQSLCKRWSQATGHDLADSAALARLMLKASLVANPDSIVLFSSKSPAHIQSNTELARDFTLDAAARQLHHLVQSEGAELLSTHSVSGTRLATGKP